MAMRKQKCYMEENIFLGRRTFFVSLSAECECYLSPGEISALAKGETAVGTKNISCCFRMFHMSLLFFSNPR